MDIAMHCTCEKEVGIGRPPGVPRSVAQFLVGFAVPSVAVAGFATCAFMVVGLYSQAAMMLAKMAG